MTPEEQERANEIFDHLQRIDAERLNQTAQNAAQNGGGGIIPAIITGIAVIGAFLSGGE